MDIIVPFALAAALSIINWFSETYSEALHRYHSKLTSFSAGIFITYIFLVLLREVFEGVQLVGENIFLIALLGFVLFHVLEKYIYQHVTSKKHVLYELAALHVAGFFADHFLIGVLLLLIFGTGNVALSVFAFIPLMLHTISSSISLTHLDEHVGHNKLVILLLSAAPFLGVLTAYLLDLGQEKYYMLLSFIVGAMLYIVIRDALPHGKSGNILFFLIGFSISMTLLILAGLY